MESFWLSKSAYCNRESEGTPKSAQVKDPRFIPQGYISLYSSPWRGLQENQVMAFSAWKGSSVMAQDALFLSISKLSPLHLTDRHKVKKMGWHEGVQMLRNFQGAAEKIGRKVRQGERGIETHIQRGAQKRDRITKECLLWVFLGCTLHLCVFVHSGRRSDLRRQESFMRSCGKKNYKNCEQIPEVKGII